MGGVLYFIPEFYPAPLPTPIAIVPEPVIVEPVIVEPELKITVLQTIPYFATVLIDIPPTRETLTALKTELVAGVLKIRYNETEKNIPLFPNMDSVILHSEFTENRVILEVSKK